MVKNGSHKRQVDVLMLTSLGISMSLSDSCVLYIVVTLLFMSRTLEHDKSAMMSQILANIDVLFYDTE